MSVNVKVKILPFGHTQLEIRENNESTMNEMTQVPVYSEPKTTNQEIIRITFDGDGYKVPETTSGKL